MTTEPTRPDLEAIRARAERLPVDEKAMQGAMRTLLRMLEVNSDNKALLAYVAALEEIARQIVTVPPWDAADNFNCFFHHNCDPRWVGPDTDEGYWQHTADCPVTRARALLGE